MQREDRSYAAAPENPRPPSAGGKRRKRRITHELELSGKIQEKLLFGKPPEPTRGIRVAVVAQPAGHVGGDFYEFFQYGPRVHDVVVGDVMGKGFPAAMVGAALKAQLLRHSRGQRAGEEHRLEGTPAWILERVHRGIVGDLIQLGYFATLCYARFDLGRRLLSYVDCGHPPGLHYRALEGDVASLGKAGGGLANVPLGMHKVGEFRDMKASFSPGDTFLFYTDGLTELLGEQRETAGRARLTELLAAHGSLPPEELLGGIREEALGALGPEELPDDLTVMAVQIGELEPEKRDGEFKL